MTNENNISKDNHAPKIYKENFATGTISSIFFLVVVGVLMYFVAKVMGM